MKKNLQVIELLISFVLAIMLLINHLYLIIMARIKLAHIAADIRGKVGGTVFSKGTYGAYIRTKVTPVNPSSTAQSLVRTRMTAVAQAWRGLTANQILAWNNAVQNFKGTNIFGDVKVLTGFNLYGKLNRYRQTLGLALISTPPEREAVTAFTTLTVAANTTGGTITATFTPAIPVLQNVIVWATAPQSAGKSFVKSEYNIIEVLSSADISPYDFTTSYVAKYGALPPIGMKVFVKMVPVIIASGVPGAPFDTSDIAV